ncbi:hypothetical protein S40293_06059 [Stachybotrys chartarum IBT 40293]|nr:hypothetical protein S40293_06059 [Stachybotrys chartarum IBT 40293]
MGARRRWRPHRRLNFGRAQLHCYQKKFRFAAADARQQHRLLVTSATATPPGDALRATAALLTPEAMAPVSDILYFPSLDDCLAGERILLSWRHVATALSDTSGQRQKSSIIIEFLRDEHVHGLFKEPSKVFAPPSEATKKIFETKTAPINAPSRYDPTVLKQDAEWLSKNAKINLVAALRIAVIELQSRAYRHLTGPLSSQDVVHLQEAAGLNNGQGKAFVSNLGAAAALDADEISAEFDKPEARKRRLFDTYLAERRYFLAVADCVHTIKLYGRLPSHGGLAGNLSELCGLKLSTTSHDELEFLLPAYIQALTDGMGRIESGLKSVTDEDLVLSGDLELDWLGTHLSEAVHALSVIFQVVDKFGNDFPPSSAVSQWFSIMDMYSFFEYVQPLHDSLTELIQPLKTLAVAISLAFLKPARSLTYLTEREEDLPQQEDAYDSYLLSSDVLEQIHKTILNATNAGCDGASPVILAWTLLLHRMNVSYQTRTEKRDHLLQQKAQENFESKEIRPTMGRRNSAGSIFSIESSKFDGFLETANSTKDLQVVEQLAAASTSQGKVYDVLCGMAESLGPSINGSMPLLVSSRIKSAFLELLKVSYPIIGYQAEPLSALMAVLSSGRPYWDVLTPDDLTADQDVVATMIQDDYAMEFYFQQALSRFPYELMPFIALCRALCSTACLTEDDERSEAIVDLLRRTPTLTIALPNSFQDYELTQEDENTNTFCLLGEIPLIAVLSSWKRSGEDDGAYRLAPGTFGRFITDTGRVAIMEYEHSTLSLLGRLLEIHVVREGVHTELGMLGPEEIAETITLFATLTRMEGLKSQASSSNNVLVLADSGIAQELSKDLGNGKDILAVICDIMDYHMQDELALGDEAAIKVLSAGVKFLHAHLPLQPGRVWSYLARSEFLGSVSRAGKLAKITGCLELVSARFELLASSMELFLALVENAATSAVQRRAGYKLPSRQKNELGTWQGNADKMISKVSYSIAQMAVDVFENTSTWVFESESKRSALLLATVPILNKLILYTYGMGSASATDDLSLCLRPAASYVVDCFASSTSGTLRFQPLLSSLMVGFLRADTTLYPVREQIMRDQLISALELSATLLKVTSHLDHPSTEIISYMFKSSTLLARLCAKSDHFRGPAIRLLDALVVNAVKSTQEPPSLLGYLGPQISKSFLQVLSALGQPFVLPAEVRTTWAFFSSILRNRQQWMSNCLLTGQTPREAMKEHKKTEISKDSVFATALLKIKHLQDLETQEALAILDFVASAQNYWPWMIFALQKDAAYLEGPRAYARNLQPFQVTVKSDVVRASQEARIAAYIAEISAMQLYHSRHLGKAPTLAKDLVNDLDYYLRDGVEVAGYNKSLHINFAKNFSNKYFGSSLDNFKRTPLESRDLGFNYFYDLDRADALLNFDPGWLGAKGNGFKAEMELANANLSLVDAQIALFHAWESLLLELSTCVPDNQTVIRYMLQVTQQCLNANQSIPGPETIFLKLVNARANLALVLVQRLVKHSFKVQDINELLATLLGTIRALEEPFSQESISYSRVLLKTLFVTLRAYQVSEGRTETDSQSNGAGSAVTITQTILNILDRVVGRGFRLLVSLVHDQEAAVLPEDLALHTAILQACLSLPNIEQSQAQILNIMASHDTVHAATSLFSWSDKLSVQGDPVYGELSILFLMELSNLPLMAEQIACDGILSSILSAKLVKLMGQANVSPVAETPVAQRCYGIWVKGLLPLMLNLLTALGPTVAPEITYVLNQFPHLLQASVDRFEAPGSSRIPSSAATRYLTLLATSEVHSLALLIRVLAALRVNNSRDIPAVQWDAAGLAENVEFWLSSRRLLKERLLPLGQRELDWRNTKTKSSDSTGCENLLEEKVVSQLETVRDVLNEQMEG